MPTPTILSTRNGSGSVSGYRDDLVAGDLVGLSLSNYTGITSVLWELIGRPEGSAAGGAGPEPIFLATANSTAFNVDSDSGDFRLDGTYTVQATLNPGSPGQVRITTVLCRLSGLTIPGPGASVRVLRKLGGFEALEDTSVPTVLQGWATELNRWLELLRETVTGGAGGFTTLAGAYSHGADSSDQTMVLHDALGGGIIIDATQGNFTGASALRVNTAAGGPVVIDRATGRVGIGIAAPLQAVHAKGTAPAVRLDRTGGAALDVMNVGDDLQFLNGATVLGIFKSTGGLQADLGVGIGTPPATFPALAFGAGSATPISAAGTARFRYNEGTGHAEFSENAGPYLPFASPFAAYQTIDANGTPLTQRSILNFSADLPAVDNGGATRTDVSLANAGAGAGTYGGSGLASITLDAKGRVTAAAAATYVVLTTHTATSVLGNPTGSSGSIVDIVATVDGQFLGRAGGVLAWGGVPYTSLTGAPTIYYQTVDAAGTPLTQRQTLNVAAPLTAVDNGGATRTDLALAIDGSLAVSGGNLQRSALTGDVTAAAGSNATAFRSFAATSVLANATGGSAVPSDLAATVDGQTLFRTGAALTWGLLPATSVTGLFYQTVDGTGNAALTQRPALNFGTPSATGLNAVDNAGASRTDVTNTLITGLAGGQTAVGGTATGNALTLKGNNFDTNGGTIFFNDSSNFLSRNVPSSFGAQLTLNNFVTLYGGAVGVGTAAGLNIGSSSGPGGNAPITISVSGNASKVVSITNASGGVNAAAGFVGAGALNGPVFQLLISGAGTANPYTTSLSTVDNSFGVATPLLFNTAGSLGGDMTFLTSNTERLKLTAAGEFRLAERATSGSPPASGFGYIRFDSTAHNLWAKNSSGVESHTIKTFAAVSHNFLTALDDDGTVHAAQPAYSDISGTPTLYYQTVAEAGSSLTQRLILNFDGTVVAADSASPARTNIGLPVQGGLTPGSYTNTSLTVDAYGRLTVASSGAGATSFYQTFEAAGTPVTQRPTVSFSADFGVVDNSGATRTDITLANAGAGPGLYGGAGLKSLTLDAQGRVTAVTTATYLIGTGASPGTFNNVTITGDGLVTGGSNVAYLTSAFYQTVAEAGSALTQRGTLNFDGTVVAADDVAHTRTNVGLPNVGPGAGLQGGSGISGIVLDAQGRVTTVNATSYYSTIQAFGGGLTQRPTLNFDHGVVSYDDGANSRTDVRLGSVSAPSAPTIAEFGGVAPSAVAAANLQAVYQWDAINITLTGVTHVTGNGLGLVNLQAPTITDASAVTVDAAATFAISGAPTAGGSVTLTHPISLWVQSGATQLDGWAAINTPPGGVPTNTSLIVTADNNNDRDRVQFFLGGGTLGPTGTGDSTFFDILPSNTSVNSKSPSSPAIYSTVRVRSLNYSGGSALDSAAAIASLYIDAAPTTSFMTGPTFALYVGSGDVHLGSTLEVVSTTSAARLIATGASAAFDADGSGGTASISFFGAAGAPQQTGGATTAGVLYTATEQGMMNRMYSALRNYGLLT